MPRRASAYLAFLLVRQWLVASRKRGLEIRARGIREVCDLALAHFVNWHDVKVGKESGPHRNVTLKTFVAQVRQQSRGIVRHPDSGSTNPEFWLDTREKFKPQPPKNPPRPKKPRKPSPPQVSHKKRPELQYMDSLMREWLARRFPQPGAVLIYSHDRKAVNSGIVKLIHAEIPALALTAGPISDYHRLRGSLIRCGCVFDASMIGGKARFCVRRRRQGESRPLPAFLVRRALAKDATAKRKRRWRTEIELAKMKGLPRPRYNRRKEKAPDSSPPGAEIPGLADLL